MYTKGHIGISLLLYSYPFYYLLFNGFVGFAIVGLLFVGSFSALPDQDQNVWFMEHRGRSHSIGSAIAFGIFTVLILVLLFTFSAMFLVPLGSIIGVPPMAIFGFFGFIATFTFITHLLGDLLTPAGVRILRPFSDKKYGADLVKASNPIANIAFWLIGWGTVILVIVLFVGTVLASVLGA